MISVSVTVPVDVLDAIADAAQQSPKLMETAFKRQISRLKRQVLDELADEPGKPKYPLRWKSARQRRFVMAKLRRENNLPYQRKHQLAKGWRVTDDVLSEGGLFAVENATPYARFVQGDDAQPFHLDTGWTQVGEVVSKYREIAEERLIQTWFTVADPSAGISGKR